MLVSLQPAGNVRCRSIKGQPRKLLCSGPDSKSSTTRITFALGEADDADGGELDLWLNPEEAARLLVALTDAVPHEEVVNARLAADFVTNIYAFKE